jgi:hypothetical protein
MPAANCSCTNLRCVSRDRYAVSCYKTWKTSSSISYQQLLPAEGLTRSQSPKRRGSAAGTKAIGGLQTHFYTKFGVFNFHFAIMFRHGRSIRQSCQARSLKLVVSTICRNFDVNHLRVKLTSSSSTSAAPRLFLSLRNFGPLSLRSASFPRPMIPWGPESAEMRFALLSSHTTLRLPFISLGRGAYPTPSMIRMLASTAEGMGFDGLNNGEEAVA